MATMPETATTPEVVAAPLEQSAVQMMIVYRLACRLRVAGGSREGYLRKYVQ